MPNFVREPPPLSPEDQRLVEAYERTGMPVDDLPYTPDFDRLATELRAKGDSRDAGAILRRLMNLRKAARLPRVGRLSTPTIRVPPEDVALLERLLRESMGSLGSRDQLPYTDRFEEMFQRYNALATAPLPDRHHFWRLIARVCK